MTAVQLALDCEPTWTVTVDRERATARTLARIEAQTLAEPANPNYQPNRRAYRRVRDVRLANQEYL